MDTASLVFKADLRELEKAQKELKDLAREGKKTEKATDKISKGFTSMGGAAKKVAIGVGAMGAALGAVFAIVGSKALGMASDMEETQGKFDVVFRGLTEDAESWSKTLVDGYAMSNVESKKYLSNIQDLIVPTGMMREEAGELSNQFVKMAADLGSFNNLPTEKVIMDIQSALAGSAETMLKYGIDVKVAQVEQEAFNMGLIKNKKELTKAHKVQAIYSIMMREGADAVGDMARTSESYANQTKLLKANIDNLYVAIGKELLPKATALVDKFNDWWKINKDLVTQDISKFIGSVMDMAEGAAKHLGIMVENAKGWIELFNQMSVKKKISELNTELRIAEKELAKVNVRFAMLGESSDNVKKAEDKVRQLETAISNLRTGTSTFGALTSSVGTFGDSLLETKDKAVILNEELIVGSVVAADAMDETWINHLEKKRKASEKQAVIDKKILDAEVKENARGADQITDVWLGHFEGKADAAERGLELENEILVKEYEANENTVGAMDQLWTTFARDTEGTFRTVIGDGLRGEFDSIGDAWKSFTDNMVSTFIGAVAQMAAQQLASSLFGDLFGGSGSGKKEDSGTDWLSAAGTAVTTYLGFAEGGTHTGGWRVVGEKGPELEYTGASQIFSNQQSTNMMSQGSNFAPGDLLEDNNWYLREGNKTTEDLSELTQDHTKVLDDHLNSVNDLDDTTKTNSGTTQTNTETVSTSTEVTKTATKATEKSTKAESENTGALGGLTDSLGSFGETLGGVIDGMRSMSAMQKTAVAVATVVSPVLGLAVATGIGAYNYTEEEKAKDQAIRDDIAEWSGRTSGMGESDTGSGSGIGDTGGGTPDHEPGGSFGMAQGGIVSNLLVPKGDDGYAALSLGEGVLDSDTMSVLSRSIKDGSFNKASTESVHELKALRQLLAQVGLVLGRNTQKTTKLLRGFEERGIATRA